MKLQVTQENLAKALSTVARVANSRNTLPILSNVLLRTDKNRLSIAATNLDIAITQYIGSKIEKNGAITVPARLMQDFVTSLPDSILNLELKDNKLSITTDQYQSTINGIAADDFLGFTERTVVEGQLAALRSDPQAFGGSLEAGGVFEPALAEALVHELLHVVHQRLGRLNGLGGFGVLDHHQELHDSRLQVRRPFRGTGLN